MLSEVDLDDQPDVVESSPRRLGRRGRRVVAALVVALVVLASAAWFLDGRRRDLELTNLTSCVRTAESAWSDADARVVAMSSYVRPSVGSGPSAAVQLGLYRLVADQAALGEPAVGQALARCQAESVLSFHTALRAAHTAYVTSLQAEDDRLTATMADGSRAFAGSDQLTSLRAQAKAALLLAAPDAATRATFDRLMTRS